MVSSPPAVLKVLIADDHELTRCTLKLTLMRQNNLKLVGVACNGQEVIEQVKTQKPDVVILDMHMPIMDGWTASRIIKNQFPATRIIAYSSVEGGKSNALKEGAVVDAFCEKGTCTEQIMDTIRSFF